MLGGCGVADSGWVMPQALSADSGTSSQTRRWEIANIGEGNLLLNPIGTATGAHGRRTIVGTRVNVVLHHANTILELVSIQLIPLVSSQSALPTPSAIIVANFRSNDDTAKISFRAAVESGKRDTGLGNQESGEWNAIGIETRGGNSCGRRIPGNYKDVGCNSSMADWSGGRSRRK